MTDLRVVPLHLFLDSVQSPVGLLDIEDNIGTSGLYRAAIGE